MPTAAHDPLLLSELPRGASAAVAELLGDDALSHTLMAAGLWPGAEVQYLGSAPFGDPMLFRVHGYRLALRRSEAKRVRLHQVVA